MAAELHAGGGAEAGPPPCNGHAPPPGSGGTLKPDMLGTEPRGGAKPTPKAGNGCGCDGAPLPHMDMDMDVEGKSGDAPPSETCGNRAAWEAGGTSA